MSIEQLRNFASVIREMEASVKGDRTRKKKRGAPRDEPAQYDEPAAKPGLVEDEHGYLPEERQERGVNERGSSRSRGGQPRCYVCEGGLVFGLAGETQDVQGHSRAR